MASSEKDPVVGAIEGLGAKAVGKIFSVFSGLLALATTYLIPDMAKPMQFAIVVFVWVLMIMVVILSYALARQYAKAAQGIEDTRAPLLRELANERKASVAAKKELQELQERAKTRHFDPNILQDWEADFLLLLDQRYPGSISEVEIEELLPVPKSKLRYHMDRLLDCGLVVLRHEPPRHQPVYYLDPSGVKVIHDHNAAQVRK